MKFCLGLVKITFWLVHASHSLPEGQVVKLTFFVTSDQVDIGLKLSLINLVNIETANKTQWQHKVVEISTVDG